MYLKSMELQGFKSFANKIKLEFHDGITGIVGPNGSGKSNVADAVRWVLGEQSAKSLRGGNMQDVIFSGTENRKPLGFASVTITLDNSDRKLGLDADEVEVTRRLYRSGESEYKLNGHACRLRDINELFYDTGIGKEGYSIIGQGQIEKILNGKPEDRRELFDEAAGIVKFKRRKAASLKKLDQEQSNLVRVNDILSEITRQLGPLESQAKKAEQYLARRDRLRSLDLISFRIESEKIEHQQKELTEKLGIADAHHREVESQLARTKMEYERIERDLEELDQKIEDTRSDAQESRVQKEQTEGRINVLNEQIRAAESNREIYRERVDAIQSEGKRRREELEAELAEKAELEKSLREAEQKKKAGEEKLAGIREEIRGKNEEIDKCRSDTIELLNDRAAIKEKIQRYNTMIEQTDIRKSELSSRMLQAKGGEDEERAALEKLEKEIAEVGEEAERQKNAMDETDAALAEIQSSLDEADHRLQELSSVYHRDASRLESLRSITERYEGYGNSVRKVMEQKESNPGIHGVVADLVSTEKKYETAIETALGGSLQNIVTDNENTAKYLIEFLKRGHFGRATFLPITAVRGERPFARNDVLAESGVLGVASSLVKCEKVYEGIILHLLGRTVVVDNIDHAIAVSRKYRQSVRMVTLEGEMLSAGGSMTGGSFRYKNNLLGRRREIEELEHSTRAAKKQMEDLRTSAEEKKNTGDDLRRKQQEQNESLQKLYLRQNSLNLQRNVSKNKLKSLEKGYDDLEKECREIDGQIREIREKRDAISGELTGSQDEEQSLSERVDALSAEIERLEADEKSGQTEFDEARLIWSGVRQKVDFTDEKIRNAEQEIRRKQDDLDELTEKMAGDSQETSAKQKEIEKLRKSLSDYESISRNCEDAIQAYLKEKEELNKDHRDFFTKRDELLEEKNSMEQETFRLRTQLEKQEETKDGLINYLYEEYQMTPDMAEKTPLPDELPDRSTLRKEIAGLRKEIRDLGSVNVNAIEEYRELKERCDFMTAQHDDLVRATEQLQGIIQELDEGMRRQFREKFDQIRTEFNSVFRQLFGGGKGTLELEEGEDILESGIVIIAQPPGKKLQNMMQLSGGEKALTAISLLFAIQNLKPSPFCLLDEIEAALDDSNVTRYAEYLHKLTKNTQFIIITHRRGTMRAADRLYGITMQEKGVSTLVSVDLIESQLDK